MTEGTLRWLKVPSQLKPIKILGLRKKKEANNEKKH